MGLILAVDIGGTNSRFAAFEAGSQGQPVMKEKVWLSSTQAGSFGHLLQMLEQSEFPYSPQDFDIAVIALAGPVIRGVYCNVTNVDWDVDFSNGSAVYGFKDAVLINDFVAQAYACRTSAVQGCKVIHQVDISPVGTVGVIGAGTGLGHCALVPAPAIGFIPVPSEAGHITFPFETAEELDFCAFVKERRGISYCYGDEILTGKGLNVLHHYLTGEDLKPREVAAKMAEGGLTLEWYAKFTARCCRNYALSVCATGGLYISGGIIAKNPFVVDQPVFMEEFLRSSSMKDLLKRIPVFLNDNQDSGLYGAALRGLLHI
ncbi:glucokinase [Maridesulfovibrio hydrothermalis]|uniref:Glucokinase n=1 Tax=Maridesulfovibrio hydrothermalis AM13 = DSM 14728 TaxID=1121451 RepID=L0RF79_9BACT|nr:glucokinase [Maridesulfovibrio hydrothermalis]CCO24865.1 Glucokinase [Maridesulfovibrio hydrothermalis AM13 = DSM 14728]